MPRSKKRVKKREPIDETVNNLSFSFTQSSRRPLLIVVVVVVGKGRCHESSFIFFWYEVPIPLNVFDLACFSRERERETSHNLTVIGGKVSRSLLIVT